MLSQKMTLKKCSYKKVQKKDLCHTHTVVRRFDLPEDFPMNLYQRNKETVGFHQMRFKTKPFIGFKIDQTIGFKSVAKWETNCTIQRLTYTVRSPIDKRTLFEQSISKSLFAAFDAQLNAVHSDPVVFTQKQTVNCVKLRMPQICTQSVIPLLGNSRTQSEKREKVKTVCAIFVDRDVQVIKHCLVNVECKCLIQINHIWQNI